MKEGVYVGMPAAEYHAAPGLSHSGTAELAVSPMQYWHRYLDPARPPDEPTPAMRRGTAIHARVLEPGAFALRYARKLREEDHPAALRTNEELKAWLEERGVRTAKLKVKEQLSAAVREVDPGALVWAEVVKAHARANAGKELLDEAEWRRVDGAARAALAAPAVSALMRDGFPEVSVFVRDPATGVMLKSRLDYLTAARTIDVKSFTVGDGEPVAEAVRRAFRRFGYHRQAVFYSRVRELARKKLAAGEIEFHGWGALDSDYLIEQAILTERPPFTFVFVQSAAPHHVRVKTLSEGTAYWDDGEARVAEAVAAYRACRARFGDQPWRDEVAEDLAGDEDFPWLAYSAAPELDWSHAEELEAAAP